MLFVGKSGVAYPWGCTPGWQEWVLRFQRKWWCTQTNRSPKIDDKLIIGGQIPKN